MLTSKSFVKTITNAQMDWLINTKKVWFVESEGFWFSRNYIYAHIPGDMDNPLGHYEVHK